MDASASALEADDRANELYWGSDMSVNQIADALDLSKGALYEMIRPLPAALGCPRCGAEAVHPNRTAKERGLVSCPACGWGGAEGAAAPAAAPTVPGLPAPRGSAPAEATAPRAPRSGSLAGGILIGAAVGFALYLWARRK